MAAEHAAGGAAAGSAACVIWAQDAARTIAQTVRAAKEIPAVDAVIVVDDASADGTERAARRAGAQVLVHDVRRGRAASELTGACAVRNRDVSAVMPDRAPRLRPVLFVPAGAGERARAAAALVAPVLEGRAALASAAGEPALRCASRASLDAAAKQPAGARRPATAKGWGVRAQAARDAAALAEDERRIRAAGLTVVQADLPGCPEPASADGGAGTAGGSAARDPDAGRSADRAGEHWRGLRARMGRLAGGRTRSGARPRRAPAAHERSGKRGALARALRAGEEHSRGDRELGGDLH
ncbi:glycosyltransferase [Brevibacterium sp. BRM-1]|uniref:glycosyltransferase n=1 Tax=Brevibacterium sp. BRM-1 TaxID=2999062 RepID=UPI00227E1225|nr:glycosyltransferase [Brevibacterium sp. BRM-1]WAL39831.1 glycosyltransferase [Brevibacterium sp. BRM-1]